jgi:hypothetical protein
MGDWKEQLARIAPASAHLRLFYAIGSAKPQYNELPVLESLKKFCADFLPLSPFIDPRKKEIKVVKNNFPKLAGLQHMTLDRDELTAGDIIAAIENGTFDPGDYDPTRDDRIQTLFWLPEVLTDPDAIYRNGHRIVAGNRVYVRVYDKMGSKVKLAFTLDYHKNRRLIRTVVVTSFLTNPADAISCIKGEPLYERPKSKEPSD